jgi:DNA invertase Pin-like site-specific DNA recombinase
MTKNTKTKHQQADKHHKHHKHQRVGYIRVSTLDQNTIRQLEGVTLDKTFTDKASGKDTHRPALVAALEYVREGDVLVVHSLDRLARNLEDLLGLVRKLTERGVTVEFISERLTFSGDDQDTPAGGYSDSESGGCVQG